MKASLLTIIQTEKVKEDALFICFLGQAGFLVKSKDRIFLIDPYLSNYVEQTNPNPPGLFTREFEPPINPGELRNIDVIFLTHEHGDHCDPMTLKPILENNLLCKIIAPSNVINFLRDQCFSEDQLIKCKIDEPQVLAGIAYEAIPAAHYQLAVNKGGDSECVGYLISCNGITIYHAGDTIMYKGMAELIRSKLDRVNVGCLPVNGRDQKREDLGIIGNLTPQEALALSGEIVLDLMIPMHNDLFKANRLNPEELNRLNRDKFPKQKVKWMLPGEYFIYSK